MFKRADIPKCLVILALKSRDKCKLFVIYLLDMISQLELGKPEERRKPVKQVNGIFWILLLNIGIYVADHLFQVIFFFFFCYSSFVGTCIIKIYGEG